VDEELRRELEATVSEYRASLAPRIAALEALRGELASGKAARAAEAFVELRCAGGTPDAAAWEQLKALLQDLARAAP